MFRLRPLSMVTRRTLSWGASFLLHLGLVAGVLVGGRWVLSADASKLPVLPVEIVTIAEGPPPPAATSVRAAPKPARALLPRTPLAVAQPAQASRPVIAEPPAPAAPSASAPLLRESAAESPSLTAVTESPLLSGPSQGAEAGSSAGPPVSSPSVASASGPVSSPSVASASGPDTRPLGALTQFARPQGGYQVTPGYPASALRLGIQGTTLLRVRVLIDGRVGDVIVQRSAGHPDLDQAAADAVRRWRFEPAQRGNDPVAMWVLLPVEFQIK